MVCRETSRHALVRESSGLFVVAYALSPIDLIPDFVPVLGYVDDILLLPVQTSANLGRSLVAGAKPAPGRSATAAISQKQSLKCREGSGAKV